MSRSLAVKVYRATDSFPSSERFSLTTQMRRAAVSVGSNVAEGSELSDRAFGRHLKIALGSIAELEFQAHLASDLGYLDEAGRYDLSAALALTGRSVRRLLARVSRVDPDPHSHQGDR